MRFLAAGDIHGDINCVYYLADKAEREGADSVVLCGDIAADDGSTDGLIGPLVNKNKRVLLVPGNHEDNATIEFLAQRYGVSNLHGRGVRYASTALMGAGGANVGSFRLQESELFKLLNDSAHRMDYDEIEQRVMVTHVHPKGSSMDMLPHIVPGSSGVSKALQSHQPDILVCAHVHEAHGIEERIGNTRVVNAGREGKVIDVSVADDATRHA